MFFSQMLDAFKWQEQYCWLWKAIIFKMNQKKSVKELLAQ